MVILRVTAGWRGRKAALLAVAIVAFSAASWAAHYVKPLMKLWVTGLNHRTAPVSVRERLAFSPGDLEHALAN